MVHFVWYAFVFVDKETGTEDGLLCEEITVPALQPWLLGYDLTQSKDEIVLTSSAADTLIAIQNLPVPALCLPSGEMKQI